MKRSPLSLFALMMTFSCQEVAFLAPPSTKTCQLPLEAPTPDAPLKEFLRYNFVQQKSSHNSYDKELSLSQQLGLGIRSLELDIHRTRGNKDPLPEDWYVFHIDAPLLRDTSCESLSACLEELKEFHDAHPSHEVITVWVDLKDDFTAEHSPQRLDEVLTQRLPRELIVAPDDLLSSCPEAIQLKDAVQGACHWPTLNALQGKFIFAVTGSGLGPGELLSEYLDGDPIARVAFVAPGLDLLAQVGSFDDAVFYNLNIKEAHLMPEVLAQGFVGRIWKANKPGPWTRASLSCANHIATDRLDTERYPWAKTQTESGWPFFCLESLGVDCSALREE